MKIENNKFKKNQNQKYQSQYFWISVFGGETD